MRLKSPKIPTHYFEGWPIRRLMLQGGDFVALQYRHGGNPPDYKSEYDVANNVFRLSSTYKVRWQVHRDDWDHIEKMLEIYPEEGSIGRFRNLFVEDEQGNLKESDSSWDSSPPLLLMPGERVLLGDLATSRLFDVDLETGQATGRPVPPNSRLW